MQLLTFVLLCATLTTTKGSGVSSPQLSTDIMRVPLSNVYKGFKDNGLWTIQPSGSSKKSPSNEQYTEAWALIIPLGTLHLPVPAVRDPINGTTKGPVSPQPPASPKLDKSKRVNSGQQSPQPSSFPKFGSLDSKNPGQVSPQLPPSRNLYKSIRVNSGQQSPQPSSSFNSGSLYSKNPGQVSPQLPPPRNLYKSIKVNGGQHSPRPSSSPDSGLLDSEKPDSTNVCLLPVDVGQCRGKIIRYRYVPKQKQCVPFIWSGCGGNKNRFVNKHKCELACRV